MFSRRSFRIVVCCAVTVGACGGNDDGDAESDRNAATSAGSVVVSAPGGATPAGSSVDDNTDNTTDDPSGTTAPDRDGGSSSDSTTDVPAMVRGVTIPMDEVGSFGNTIAVSPDGSEVALWSVASARLTVFDSSSGELVRSADFDGAGSDVHWTSDNRLVTTNDIAIRTADAATLEPAEAVDLTLGPDAEGCTERPLAGTTLDRESNAVFSTDFHDLGVIVCRVDLANSEMIATVIDGAAAPSLYVRPGAAEILVAYNAETQLGPGMTATLDGTTLELLSTVDGRVSGVTASDEIVEVEQYSYRLSGGGPIARLSSIRGGQPVGPYLYGLEFDDDFAETFLLFDVSSAEAVYSIPDAPIGVDLQSSDDGSTVAFIDDLSIQIFTTP